LSGGKCLLISVEKLGSISRQKLNVLPWFVDYFIFNHLSKSHRTFNKSFSWNSDC